MNNHLNTTLTEIYRTVGRHARNSANPDAEDHLQEAMIASLERLAAGTIEHPKAYVSKAYRRNSKPSTKMKATVAIGDVDGEFPSTAPDPERQAIVNCRLRRIVRESSRIDRSVSLAALFGGETSSDLPGKAKVRASRLRNKLKEKMAVE
ncbi:hypothetical protein [Fodinicurvata sp. EGI_FJ10296]|uniref:RNA polymerase sigma factor n=1 Tax=Fodinicurvata sp. EGI_FJ10296 TaxID=3231908 RepID=UPI003454E721